MYTERNILKLDPFQTLDEDGVGKLIEMAVKQAKKVTKILRLVYGELGGDAKSIHYFNHLPIDYVSCSPFRIQEQF